MSSKSFVFSTIFETLLWTKIKKLCTGVTGFDTYAQLLNLCLSLCYAISRAISIIFVKEFWRSSAVVFSSG